MLALVSGKELYVVICLQSHHVDDLVKERDWPFPSFPPALNSIFQSQVQSDFQVDKALFLPTTLDHVCLSMKNGLSAEQLITTMNGTLDNMAVKAFPPRAHGLSSFSSIHSCNYNQQMATVQKILIFCRERLLQTELSMPPAYLTIWPHHIVDLSLRANTESLLQPFQLWQQCSTCFSQVHTSFCHKSLHKKGTCISSIIRNNDWTV